MRNVHRSLSSDKRVELAVYLVFRNRVESGGRLVKDNHRRVAVQRPGDRGFLPLSARKVGAVLVKALVEHGVKPVRELLRVLPQSRKFQHALQFLVVRLFSESNIFTQAERKQLKILKHNGKQPAVLLLGILLDIHAVNQNFALRNIVQPAQQLDERSFSRAVQPNN